jgi:hypothetical protein
MMLHAVRITGDSRGNLIQNNLLGGATQASIEAADTAAVVQGNVEV